MAKPNLSRLDEPFGPLRDKFSETIGTDDYDNPAGFICQLGSGGDITYRTLEGTIDQTESGLSEGDVINVAGIPVVLISVRGSSTVTSIVVGLL